MTSQGILIDLALSLVSKGPSFRAAKGPEIRKIVHYGGSRSMIWIKNDLVDSIIGSEIPMDFSTNSNKFSPLPGPLDLHFGPKWAECR